MVAALAFTLEREPTRLGLLKEGDWAGIATMAVGLSALQTVLEEGNKDDWFASPFIFRLAIVAFVFLSAFIAIELTTQKPLVNLRLLKRRNFGHRRRRQHAAGFRAVRLDLYPAAISRPGAALQRRADRHGAGLDGPAATRADPASCRC